MRKKSLTRISFFFYLPLIIAKLLSCAAEIIADYILKKAIFAIFCGILPELARFAVLAPIGVLSLRQCFSFVVL